jgi:hypothetical protein
MRLSLVITACVTLKKDYSVNLIDTKDCFSYIANYSKDFLESIRLEGVFLWKRYLSYLSSVLFVLQSVVESLD